VRRPDPHSVWFDAPQIHQPQEERSFVAMSKNGRIVIIPHPKAEPDLDQIVLALLADLDQPTKSPTLPRKAMRKSS